MMQTFKAEFKKIITIRSTYITAGIFLLLTIFVAFYVHGYRDARIAGGSNSNIFLASSITQIATTLSIASAIIGLLLMAHEYRHNTIVYTLTASNSRTKVLLSKIAAIMIFVFVYSLVTGILSLSMVNAGVAVSGHTLAHQNIDLVTFFAEVVFFCEGYALAGMLLALLIRNQVGAVASLFVLPNIEGLLSLLLKHNSVYMPFTALSQVPQGSLPTSNAKQAATGYLSPAHGALVFLAWIIGGYLIAWYLFLKRDAN